MDIIEKYKEYITINQQMANYTVTITGIIHDWDNISGFSNIDEAVEYIKKSYMENFYDIAVLTLTVNYLNRDIRIYFHHEKTKFVAVKDIKKLVLALEYQFGV